MRTPIPRLSCALLAALSFGCTSTRTEQSRVSSDAPEIVLRQFPDYPAAGRGTIYPGGLIAALWNDGRMIRPTSSNTVGKSYVEGTVSPADREEYFEFLIKRSALRNQQTDGQGAAVDAAYQTLTLRRDGKKSQWIRPWPDRKTDFHEIEARLWDLPLQAQHPVDWRAVQRSRWYE